MGGSTIKLRPFSEARDDVRVVTSLRKSILLAMSSAGHDYCAVEGFVIGDCFLEEMRAVKRASV